MKSPVVWRVLVTNSVSYMFCVSNSLKCYEIGCGIYRTICTLILISGFIYRVCKVTLIYIPNFIYFLKNKLPFIDF